MEYKPKWTKKWKYKQNLKNQMRKKVEGGKDVEKNEEERD